MAMNGISHGDLAQSLFLRRSSAAAEGRLKTLTQELASGRHADVARATGGDFKLLSGIEASLRVLQAYKTTADEAALFGAGAQTALETVQTLAQDAGAAYAAAGTNGVGAIVTTAAAGARQKFDAAVAALNANVGDRYLFSGAASDQRPLIAADDMLATLTTLTTGMVLASDVVTAVHDWFAAPRGGGGFMDLAYGGADLPAGPYPVAAGESASFGVTAGDPALRQTLEGLALAALVGAGSLAGDTAGRALVLRKGGEALLAAGRTMADLRARLGTAEAAVAGARTRNSAEASALEIARNGIVAADPFETASALEDARQQLETLYTITARLSRLSLSEYLR